MGRLWLIRHGATAWSETGRHTGLTDLPLTEAGHRQAESLGRELAGVAFAAVLTSPLQRAHETARIAGLHQAQVEPGLAEWDYGGYEGLTTAEISARLGRPWTVFADGVVAGHSPGETLADVAARARAVLDRVRPVLGHGDVALVGHGHQLRVLAAAYLDLAPAQAAKLLLGAGSLSRLGSEHGVPAIELWNHVPST